jgi:hypothetical protein
MLDISFISLSSIFFSLSTWYPWTVMHSLCILCFSLLYERFVFPTHISSLCCDYKSAIKHIPNDSTLYLVLFQFLKEKLLKTIDVGSSFLTLLNLRVFILLFILGDKLRILQINNFRFWHFTHCFSVTSIVHLS